MSSGEGLGLHFIRPTEPEVSPSAHYEIKEDGSIHQLVQLEDTNWGPIIHDETPMKTFKEKTDD